MRHFDNVSDQAGTQIKSIFSMDRGLIINRMAAGLQIERVFFSSERPLIDDGGMKPEHLTKSGPGLSVSVHKVLCLLPTRHFRTVLRRNSRTHALSRILLNPG